MSSRLIRSLARLVLALCSCAVPLRAAFLGPVPAPTDAYGAAGPYAIVTQTFPSPGFPGEVVTVLSPDGVAGPRPTWFFAHGFGGTQVAYYRILINHLVSHGWVVVFSPYPPSGSIDELYGVINAGFAEAATRFPTLIDTSKVGFAGHSYGGGAVPWLALEAFRTRGWGASARCLLLLAPWYSGKVSNVDLASFPAGTLLIAQVYDDDIVNDHRMAIDVFLRSNVPLADKEFLSVHRDVIDGYAYVADHATPGPGSDGSRAINTDALVAWSVLRIAQALSSLCFDGDAEARAVALGHGAATQTYLGETANGRALRAMTAHQDPRSLYPEDQTEWSFSRLINPRRLQAPPESPATVSRLANISARARSSSGDNILIVGGYVQGPRPKRLLLRAAGPALAAFPVTAPMADPLLETYRATAPDLANDNWSAAPNLPIVTRTVDQTQAFAFAAGSADAALVATFASGDVTAQAKIASGGAGVVLLELYDADLDTDVRLVNLSARARVGTGEDVLIAGFVVLGAQPLRVLVRAVGPKLADYHVTDLLADPQLEIFQGSASIAANDDWQTQANSAAVSAAATQVNAFPLSAVSKDAALLLTLAPGAYTAQVRGANATTGNALAEVYVVP